MERKYEAQNNKRKASEISDNSFLDDSRESAFKLHRPDTEKLFNNAITINDSMVRYYAFLIMFFIDFLNLISIYIFIL